MTKRQLAIALSFIIYLLSYTPAGAQTITGHVLDAQTGDTIPMASCIYHGHGVAVAGSIDGYFQIDRHDGWPLTFSAVGYQQQTIIVDSRTPHYLRVKLKPDSKVLKEVVVKTKRQRYSRKNNPAVEMMKKVVAAKKRTDLSNHDFYHPTTRSSYCPYPSTRRYRRKSTAATRTTSVPSSRA